MDEELHGLVREARRGNQEAFSELVRRFQGPIYRHAFGMLGDRQEAEDAAQETFIKAYRYLSALESDYAFASWIMRIASHLCVDRLNRRKKERWAARDSPADAAYGSEPGADLRMALAEAMAALSPEHRQAIVLHDVQGYRYEEIADLLKIPLGTVKSRLNAARLALRNELKKGEA